jgi:hypothetical protein
MSEVFVVALGFTVRSLVFGAEVTAAGFVAFQSVEAHQFTELEEVGDATCAFE